MTTKHDYLADAKAMAAQHPGAAKRRFEAAQAELDAMTPSQREHVESEARRQVAAAKQRHARA
jgi:hypothetical protein